MCLSTARSRFRSGAGDTRDPRIQFAGLLFSGTEQLAKELTFRFAVYCSA